MYATYLALLLDIVSREMVLSSGESGDIYCPYRARAGKGSAKGCSFIFPSRAQSIILESQRERGRHLGRKGRPQCRKSLRPRPPRGFSAALPTLPHLPPSGAEVGEGWKPRQRAPEADALASFLATPAPPRPAWRDATAPGSEGGGAPLPWQRGRRA